MAPSIHLSSPRKRGPMPHATCLCRRNSICESVVWVPAYAGTTKVFILTRISIANPPPFRRPAFGLEKRHDPRCRRPDGPAPVEAAGADLARAGDPAGAGGRPR